LSWPAFYDVQFIKACELKGHSDWIRSLDFLSVMIVVKSTIFFLLARLRTKPFRYGKIISDSISSSSMVQPRDEIFGMSSFSAEYLFVVLNGSNLGDKKHKGMAGVVTLLTSR
jgi:elongator complex protein 2